MADEKASGTQRVALITGVSRLTGIGMAIASTLAQAGIDLVITYYSPFDKLAYAADTAGDPAVILEKLQGFGVRAHSIEADLGDPTVPADLFKQAGMLLGHVDILI